MYAVIYGGLGMDNDSPTLSSADLKEVVRRIVSQSAPEELEVVDAVADAWLSEEPGNGRSRGTPGAAVGFGVETVLLSQLLLPIVSGALADVLGTVALERGRLKRKRRDAKAAATGPDSAKAGSTAESGLPLQLATEQAESLRTACQRHARALGMSPQRAELLADAFLGALTRR
jgi:hypothetical protein